MQVFNAFFKIARKRIPTICLYFIIFAIICLLMTFNSDKNFTSNFQSSSLNVCVIDHDNSNASAALTDYLGSIHHLVSLPDDPETLQDNLYYRYVDYILTIPAGFETALTAEKTDGILTNVKIPDSANGHFIDQQITSYLKSLQLYLAGGYSLEDAISKTNLGIAAATSVKTVQFESKNCTDKNEYIFYFYRYLPYVLFSLIVSGLSPLLVIMNQNELKERTFCSSLSFRNRNGQIALSATLYSLIAWAAFLLLGLVCYQKAFLRTNSLYGMLNSFVFLLFCVAMTLFTSAFSPKTNVISMVSNVVGLGMCFLCGIFVPQSMLADNIVAASRFLPAYWYTRNNDMLGGLSELAFDSAVYWQGVGIQILFAIALFVAALVTTKLHKQRR